MFRNFIKAFAYFFGLWSLLYFISGLIKKKKILAIFTFHRIINPERTNDFYLNYDKGIDKNTYELHIKAIIKYFRVINQDDFLDILLGHKDVDEHSAMITFDDADADFIPHALPILQKYNCPSVIFAPTDYIGTDKRFWHLKVSNLFKKLDENKWKEIQSMCGSFPDSIAEIITSASVSNDQQKAEICQVIVNALDRLKQNVIDSVISEMEKVAGSEYTLGIKCMDWNELREIQKSNVVVESHSAEHQKLAQQTLDKIKQELSVSKNVLERKLDCNIKTICYPAGSFNADVLRMAKETKYIAGYTTIPGRCIYPCKDEYIFRLPRYSTYGDNKYSIHLFMGKIALENIKNE